MTRSLGCCTGFHRGDEIPALIAALRSLTRRTGQTRTIAGTKSPPSLRRWVRSGDTITGQYHRGDEIPALIAARSHPRRYPRPPTIAGTKSPPSLRRGSGRPAACARQPSRGRNPRPHCGKHDSSHLNVSLLPSRGRNPRPHCGMRSNDPAASSAVHRGDEIPALIAAAT